MNPFRSFKSAPAQKQLSTSLASITALVGPVFGPMLGGFITTYFHWRWIFWINVPIGIVGILLATRFIPELRESDRPPLRSSASNSRWLITHTAAKSR